jgi:hypothetical protein
VDAHRIKKSPAPTVNVKQKRMVRRKKTIRTSKRKGNPKSKFEGNRLERENRQPLFR